MPYALHGFERIHYELVGQGPPLIMNNAAGLSSGFTWRHSGWVGALEHDFQLILMTQRGEGLSSKPHTTDKYGHVLDTGDILAVMDDLGLHTAHYMGWGSGAWRGWFALQDAPERFRSLVLGCAGPYVPDRGPTESNPLLASVRQGGMDAFVGAVQAFVGRHWTPEMDREVRGGDIEAILARMAVIERTDPERYLPTLQMPLLTYASPDSPHYDGMLEATALAPHGRFIPLPGISQNDTLYAVDRLAMQIIAFLREAEVGLARETT